MRAGNIAAMGGLVLLLVLPAACGDAFGDGAGGDGGSDSGGPSQTLRQACERYCAKAVGCPDVGEDVTACVDSCLFQLNETGACAPAAVTLVDCYRTQANGCGLPSSCIGPAAAYARCNGFGCNADVLSCGGSVEFSCWCSGACGGTWIVSNPCNEDSTGTKLLCSCALTGKLAPYGPTGTVTASCEGPLNCDDSWGCCRDILLPP